MQKNWQQNVNNLEEILTFYADDLMDSGGTTWASACWSFQNVEPVKTFCCRMRKELHLVGCSFPVLRFIPSSHSPLSSPHAPPTTTNCSSVSPPLLLLSNSALLLSSPPPGSPLLTLRLRLSDLSCGSRGLICSPNILNCSRAKAYKYRKRRGRRETHAHFSPSLGSPDTFREPCI